MQAEENDYHEPLEDYFDRNNEEVKTGYDKFVYDIV